VDDAYNNTKADSDWDTTFARLRAASAALYAGVDAVPDIAYGPQSRQRLDWIACGVKAAPVFIFIHGGYWQKCTKEDFALCARGPLGCGFDVVLAEYTLAPEATMTQIVSEIGALLDFLAASTTPYSTRDRAVVLSGHSAGGHLTAMYRNHPSIAYAFPISGLFDLAPIARTFLNEKLQLTRGEIEACSPQRHITAGTPMTVSVGGAELPELVRQSREYADACAAVDARVDYLEVPGLTHFPVCDDLADPHGVQMTALMRALSRNTFRARDPR
jgi:arylformamidase